MTDQEVIKALGGPNCLHIALGIKIDAARKIATRGIPWKHRPAVKALAKRKRVQLPPDFLENQRKA